MRLHGGSVSTVWASHPHPCLHTCPGQGSGTAPPTTGPGVPPGSQPGPRAAWAPGAGAKAGPGPQASISAQQVPLATYPARLPPGHMAQGREAWAPGRAVAFRPGLGPQPRCRPCCRPAPRAQLRSGSLGQVRIFKQLYIQRPQWKEENYLRTGLACLINA